MYIYIYTHTHNETCLRRLVRARFSTQVLGRHSARRWAYSAPVCARPGFVSLAVDFLGALVSNWLS